MFWTLDAFLGIHLDMVWRRGYTQHNMDFQPDLPAENIELKYWTFSWPSILTKTLLDRKKKRIVINVVNR